MIRKCKIKEEVNVMNPTTNRTLETRQELK
jgi:hypothetical protein